MVEPLTTAGILKGVGTGINIADKLGIIDLPGIGGLFGGGVSHRVTAGALTIPENLSGFGILTHSIHASSYRHGWERIAPIIDSLHAASNKIRTMFSEAGFRMPTEWNTQLPHTIASIQGSSAGLGGLQAENQKSVNLFSNALSILEQLKAEEGEPEKPFTDIYLQNPSVKYFTDAASKQESQPQPTSEEGIIAELEKAKQGPDISENETGLLNRIIAGIQEEGLPSIKTALAGLSLLKPTFDESGKLTKLQMPSSQGINIAGSLSGAAPPTSQPASQSGLLGGRQAETSRVGILQPDLNREFVQFPQGRGLL